MVGEQFGPQLLNLLTSPLTQNRLFWKYASERQHGVVSAPLDFYNQGGVYPDKRRVTIAAIMSGPARGSVESGRDRRRGVRAATMARRVRRGGRRRGAQSGAQSGGGIVTTLKTELAAAQ